MIREIKDSKAPIKIWASDLNAETENQIKNVANLPFIHRHIAVMPDAHLGKGSTIGTVFASRGAIIPAAVGVDIGCGMSAVQLPLTAPDLKSLAKLRHSIERSIPTGREGNNEISERCGKIIKLLGAPPSHNQSDGLEKKAASQLGSLGGGNHFIEVCVDTNGAVWILLHSGSRNIGKRLAELHINQAKGLMKERLINLPDKDLSYLVEKTPEFDRYIRDLMWAQKYAKFNREEMLLRVVKDLSFHVYSDGRLLEKLQNFLVIDSHHNYVSKEEHFGSEVYLTRKGAVSARLGQYGIIPGSMGAKSFIVKGKGNPDSYHSCSHGAGRRMSRTEAREKFNTEHLTEQTRGVECRKDQKIVDEIPGAYKDIDEVMRNQQDLVEVVYELKQVLCVKGD